jgi:hypothetical protein
VTRWRRTSATGSAEAERTPRPCRSSGVRGREALAQPGIEVRGREHLRIVYGPDCTETANLRRLRDRDVGHKRSMAVERFVAGEPTWRVHQAVFGVLAMESEPVDARL